MATITTTYLDKKFNEQDTKFQKRLETAIVNLDTKFQERLENTTKVILSVMQQGFNEHSRRMDKIEARLDSLINSVDRFVKMITDQGQELAVLR